MQGFMTFFTNSLLRLFLNNATTIFSIFLDLGCLAFKIFLLFFLHKKTASSNRGKIYFYLVVILLSGIFSNISFTLYHLRLLPFSLISRVTAKIFFRIDCAAGIFQFFAFLCFFRSFSSRPISKKLLYFFIPPTIFLVTNYLFKAGYTFFYRTFINSPTDLLMVKLASGYVLFLCIVFIAIIYRNYKVEPLNLLKKHIGFFGQYFMIPLFVVKIFESDFVAPVNPLAATATSFLLTGMLFYCAKRLTGLRFLNMQTHVKSAASEKFSFIDDFKEVLERLGTISNIQELDSTTGYFFQKAFKIPSDKVSIIFKQSWLDRQKIKFEKTDESRSLYIEKIFSSTTKHPDIVSFVREQKVLISDEIEFTNFYNKTNKGEGNLNKIVEFLKRLNIDIFLPLYSGSKFVGCIIVERAARVSKFYTDIERDEMLIYANYLSSIIYLLVNMNLDSILLREQSVKAEAYKNKERLELLKRAIYPLFSSAKTRRVGVLTYKNKKFNYCNQAAKDIVKSDLNRDKGLEFTQEMLKIGYESSVYLSSKRALLNDSYGEQLVISSSPNLDKNNTIITVSNPTIADLIKDKIAFLKNQKKWHYLLALHTTDDGKIINQLLPSDAPTILNCKVAFLEYVISRKHFLLEVNSQAEALLFAHAAHKISKRQIFEEFVVQQSFDDEPTERKLFGINPMFQQQQENCLFESLNSKGTLLVKNVHLLSLNLQQKLLDFLISGKYTPLGSDASADSDLFLICSSSQNLQDLVNRGLFLKELFYELHKASVWLPSLSALPSEEFLSWQRVCVSN